MESQNSAIDQELQELEKRCGDNIRVYHDKSVRIQIAYTKIKSCTLVFKFPIEEVDQYPKLPLHIEIKSTTIPHKLQALLLKRLEATAEKLQKEGKPQAVAVFEFLDNILQNNNLIPCWTEFADIKGVIDAKKGDELKMFEKAGKIKVTLKHDNFYSVIEFEVPSQYPEAMVKMTFKDHNFDPIFAQIFESHTQNIVRRLWGGAQAGYDQKVDINEGRVGFKKALGQKEADLQNIALATRQELKHDMDFLKTQAALRSGNLDRQDRRAFKLNLKHEKKYEQSMQEKYEEEKKFATSLDDNGQTISTAANPQIYHAVKYVADYYVRFLPTAICQCCEKKLCTKLKEGTNDKMMPERAFCGHWAHYNCFETFVNTKPFLRKCPHEGCDQNFASQAFPCDALSVKHREKRWVMEEARLGEKDDLDRLFGI